MLSTSCWAIYIASYWSFQAGAWLSQAAYRISLSDVSGAQLHSAAVISAYVSCAASLIQHSHSAWPRARPWTNPPTRGQDEAIYMKFEPFRASLKPESACKTLGEKKSPNLQEKECPIRPECHRKYQCNPMLLTCFLWTSLGRAFVRISAVISAVCIYSNCSVPFANASHVIWNQISICLVWGFESLPDFAVVIALILSL